MSEHLNAKNEQAPALSQETVPFDVPETVSEAEIQQAKDAAAEEHAAREQARKPGVDEARAAVHAAMADMNQQPTLGKKQKLRQLAGMNAYSKKETRHMEQQRAEQQNRYQQAEATYQEAFREDNLQRWQEESATREQSQREQRDQEYEARTREFNETWGSMELSLNQTLQNEAIAARNEQALEPSEGTDALAAAEASIAHHEQVKNAESGTERYPNQAKSLVRAMEQQGVDFNYESVSPESELADAYDGFFTLNHGEKESKEPTVRLYRGVRDVNGSILEQASYALKSLDSVTLDGGPHEREIKAWRRQETRTKIHRFIDNPTFDNLSEYVKGLETFATPKEREKLTERMKRIETAVSEKGISVEEALREEHVNSSTFDGGLEISPYVAASADPEAAGFYADGALLAIDVPASQIAGYGEMGEVLIKGELTAENIAGVAVRKSNNSSVKQHPPAGSYEQITRMIPASESMNYDNVRGQLETAQTEREAKFAIIDRQQVEKVRSEREKRRQERAARIE